MASPKSTRAKRSTLISFDPTATITVRVGEDPRTKDFMAHEFFLTSCSEFFRRAMNGSWKEAETRIIELPEDDPETFAVYINYIYTNRLPVAMKTEEELKALENDKFLQLIIKEYDALFRVYVLAEKLQDLAAKHATMDVAFYMTKLRDKEGAGITPHTETVNLIYEGTLSSGPARRFVTDLYTCLDIKDLFKYFNCMNKDFVEDLGDSMSKSLELAGFGDAGDIVEKNGVAAYLVAPEGK